MKRIYECRVAHINDVDPIVFDPRLPKHCWHFYERCAWDANMIKLVRVLLVDDNASTSKVPT